MIAILQGDARHLPLPDGCVDLVVTSPPYFGLRSYTDGGEHYGGQIGSEATPAEWVAAMVDCTREMVRVLKPEGSIFINLGDKYSTGASGQNGLGKSSLGAAKGAGSRDAAVRYAERMDGTSARPPIPGWPPKSLLGLPWRYALACTDQLGLILRRDIIWAKPNGLPESVTDRCRSAHEYVFHLVRQPRYYSAVDEIREPHEGKRDPSTYRRTGVNGATPELSKWPNGPDGVRPTFAYETEHGRDYNPLGKLPGSVWSIPSQPLTVPPSVGVDHFAAFPVELPRRIVLGWSPPGVCVECGQGRRPVAVAPQVDPEFVATRRAISDKWRDSGTRGNAALNISGPEKRQHYMPGYITGYVCACAQPDAPTRPALILDPFAGTGTTLLAAAAYGRHAIGIDRSADYCRLAQWRVNDPGERAKAMQVPKPPPVPDGMEALF